MKLRVLKPSAFLAMVLPLAACWFGFAEARSQEETRPAEQAATATPAPLGSVSEPPMTLSPVPSELPDAAKKPGADNGKKPKGDGKGKSTASTKQASKDIPMIVPIGEIIRNVFIPQNGDTGIELSKLFAMKMKRLDEDRMEIEGMKMNLNKPDGKTDFFIDVPTSIFNLKTRLIHSDNPITVRTQDFELSGEKMEFDTVARSGKLFGRVEMRVHNLKQSASQSDENANE